METTRSDSEGEELPLIKLPEGGDLVAVGGDLQADRLCKMYRAGVFPWYEEGSPILWWSPDPRAILELEELHVSRRLQRTIRSQRFRTSFNQEFRSVIRACADIRDGETWITRDMVEAYTQLHRQGVAHSVEVWQEDQLVGGLYGVQQGGLFAGESMFYRVSDASKIALVALVEHLGERGFALFDLQILNEHTQKMGAKEIPRQEYLERLKDAIGREAVF
jgi:leucyl/phenylalanyl-tRNA--protein transferase